MENRDQITVFLADDHPALRIGLRLFLEKCVNIKVVGEAEDGFEAVQKITDSQPDIALLDVDMPGLSGLEAIRVLRKNSTKLKIIVLSTYNKREYVQEAMTEGADGYVVKNTRIEDIIKIIEDFGYGRECHSPFLLDRAVRWQHQENFPGLQDNSSLTKAETRVLRNVAEGKTNQEIASLNFVSIETIKTHVQRIFKKLGVTNRMGAVAVAKQKKLI
jgi:DNA-binding NarL/FixJ family response regulator